MSHIVIHDDSSNDTHYAEFDDVQAAASYLERLVNDDSGSNARLFSLEPVEFAVKSYVRVEIGGVADEVVAEDTAPVENVEATSPELVEEVPVAEVFTDAPADDTVEYVEAAMVPVDAFAPVAPVPELQEMQDDVGSGEPRRGLFGR